MCASGRRRCTNTWPEWGDIVLSKGVNRAQRVFTGFVRGAIAAGLAIGVSLATPQAASANPKYSGIVVDAKTGKTLYSYKADTPRYPASLTKIMTLYVLFEELEAGRKSLNSRLKVSRHAASRPPSKLGLRPGSTIRVKDAILALVTKSANDVAVTVAENVSGSVPAFAKRMTRTARRLGMKNTTFRNPSGLPNSRQKTTARDMALLGRAIQERFPKYYKYFKTRVYSYKGRRYGNHNRLLGKVKGVDGIKTGYIRASGFNLVTSVKRDGRHIVAVVMGGRTGASRNKQMKKLIASYLPKAKRGRRTAPALVARVQELRNVPRPQFKPAIPVVEEETLTGSIIPVPQKPALAAALRRKTLAYAAATKPLAAIPLPPVMRVNTQRIRAGITATAQNTVAETETTSGSVTVAANNSADPEPGWQVQIAAAETEDGAIAMLKKAKGKLGRALRGYDPYTEPVQSGGATLYRARFVGFETKTAAWNACRKLKSARFNCYAVYQ
ncbi:D-alanyl-D-alanine carboxypeptidase [Stappia taiwanensis]|uniref:D-alanyl-D-alanine carboxypeptidase n=1 Tax=Stappia taiwanensis TaxID=992267 RepID=A0A838XUY7_9HYPH|nr:D-alanyl-D-alanine carboxypeptidase [Stappia taiwanensis]